MAKHWFSIISEYFYPRPQVALDLTGLKGRLLLQRKVPGFLVSNEITCKIEKFVNGNLFRLSLILIFILSISNFSFCQERSTWSYVRGANDETLFSFIIPDFFDSEKVNFPHRLTLPNSVFWY